MSWYKLALKLNTPRPYVIAEGVAYNTAGTSPGSPYYEFAFKQASEKFMMAINAIMENEQFLLYLMREGVEKSVIINVIENGDIIEFLEHLNQNHKKIFAQTMSAIEEVVGDPFVFNLMTTGKINNNTNGQHEINWIFKNGWAILAGDELYVTKNSKSVQDAASLVRAIKTIPNYPKNITIKVEGSGLTIRIPIDTTDNKVINKLISNDSDKKFDPRNN